MLDNVEEFYNSKAKAGKWAKVIDKGQDAIFVTKTTSSSQIETHDCYNFREKGGRGQGHGRRGRGCSGSRNSKSGAEWKPQYPKAGESHVKCADYIPNHGTQDNADKCLHYKPNPCSGCLRAACAAAKDAASGATSPDVDQGGHTTPTLPATNAVGQASSALTLPVWMADTPAAGTAASTPIAPSNRAGILQWCGADF
eukprot:10926807-Ditylum_brightwellii.AAC.1